MNPTRFRSLLVAGAAVLLAACAGPESPQEVAQAFWQAALEGDSREAAEYSTLESAADYERRAEDWPDGVPSWGRLVIDDDRASVETRFALADDPGRESRTFTTYLIYRNETWLVDYERTARSVHGGLFGELFGAFDQLGREFAKEVERSSEEANEQIEKMLKEWERTQEELGRQTSSAMEAYAEELSQALEELDKSIDRGLLTAPMASALSLALGVGTADNPVTVPEEPLHVVRHESPHFRLYTNWVEPGIWTLYHQHTVDQMSVIAADVTGATQLPGEEPREQQAPAGTVLFFPYHDRASPYVHRVGAGGSTPFINFGLDFLDPPEASCEIAASNWREPRADLVKSTRRGRAYRLELPAGETVSLPTAGRGLLLVPLGAARLQLDQQGWTVELGDFQFYEAAKPSRLQNPGSEPAQLIVVDAC